MENNSGKTMAEIVDMLCENYPLFLSPKELVNHLHNNGLLGLWEIDIKTEFDLEFRIKEFSKYLTKYVHNGEMLGYCTLINWNDYVKKEKSPILEVKTPNGTYYIPKQPQKKQVEKSEFETKDVPEPQQQLTKEQYDYLIEILEKLKAEKTEKWDINTETPMRWGENKEYLRQILKHIQTKFDLKIGIDKMAFSLFQIEKLPNKRSTQKGDTVPPKQKQLDRILPTL
jgi:hypothetical protein